MDLSLLIYCLLYGCVSSGALAPHTSATQNMDIGRYQQTSVSVLQPLILEVQCLIWLVRLK